MRETLAAEGGNILIGAFTPLATFALFHMVTLFPLSWVYLETRADVPAFLGIEIGTTLICLAAIVASGALADRIGRRRLLIVCAVAIGIFALVAPRLLDGGLVGEFLYMVVGFAILGLSFGQSSGRRRVAVRAALPLHRLGADLGSRLAVRRRLRAAGGALPRQPLRAVLVRRLPAVGGGLHHHRAPAQHPPRDALGSSYPAAATAATRRSASS